MGKQMPHECLTASVLLGLADSGGALAWSLGEWPLRGFFQVFRGARKTTRGACVLPGAYLSYLSCPSYFPSASWSWVFRRSVSLRTRFNRASAFLTSLRRSSSSGRANLPVSTFLRSSTRVAEGMAKHSMRPERAMLMPTTWPCEIDHGAAAFGGFEDHVVLQGGWGSRCGSG